VARWKIEQCVAAAWWKIGGVASLWWKLEVMWLWCRGVAAVEGPARELQWWKRDRSFRELHKLEIARVEVSDLLLI